MGFDMDFMRFHWFNSQTWFHQQTKINGRYNKDMTGYNQCYPLVICVAVLDVGNHTSEEVNYRTISR